MQYKTILYAYIYIYIYIYIYVYIYKDACRCRFFVDVIVGETRVLHFDFVLEVLTERHVSYSVFCGYLVTYFGR